MKTLLRLDRLSHELRILGSVFFLVPPALALIFVALTLLFFLGNVVHSFIALMLLVALEACFPLAAGVMLSTLALQDASLELLLTLPQTYRSILFLRFALVLFWLVLVEVLATLALFVFLPWVPVKPFLMFQLTWLSPTLWLATLGSLLTLVLRSRVSSGAVLGCIWIFQLTFHGYFAQSGWTRPWFLFATLFTPGSDFWLANRLELLATSLVLACLCWWFLRSPERRFFAEEA